MSESENAVNFYEKEGEKFNFKNHPVTEEYKVDWNEKLGRGITGPVRPCTNKFTGKKYALKCMIDTPRARREVLLHYKCQGHPNIVSIYDIYLNHMRFPNENEAKSRVLVVMELMEGGELFEKIKKLHFFSEQLAVKYSLQISKAIQRCHSLNVAHRDLKPENLLLKDQSEEVVIKLSDFGFAKVDEGNLITPNFTPYFAAPQVLQALKNKQKTKSCFRTSSISPVCYDKSCDMWSLGVIVYIMLCGYPPFYSENPNTQLSKKMKEKILAGEYEFPEEDWNIVSKDAKDFVFRLLQVDPSIRLDVEEVLRHPWLISNPPNIQLTSPAILVKTAGSMDKINKAQSEHLNTLRTGDAQCKLKPINKIQNSILAKRNKVLSNISEIKESNN